MAAVKQQVLNWLYSVLTSVSFPNGLNLSHNSLTPLEEYKDVNRTYNDVAQALSHYSSLSPRTDVYSMPLMPALVSHVADSIRCSI